MVGNFNVILLNCLEHDKKGSRDKYYTLSFLDENDKSFNLYINDEIYDKCKDIKRFDEITVDLSIYLDRDNRYQFNVIDVAKNPFSNK